jgi:hypothetical protein
MRRIERIITGLLFVVTVFGWHPLAAKDALMVSFSRIELTGNSDNSRVELSWSVFKQDPERNYFDDYTPPDHISYHLWIEGLKDTVTQSESYVFRGALPLNEAYPCSVAIVETESIEDVTNGVNLADQKKYNHATFSLVQSRKVTESRILNTVSMHFQNFMRYGSVFAIASILTVVFVVGIVAARLDHLIRCI